MVEPSSKGGCNLRKRKKKDIADNMVDRISGLPDEILVSILSLLPLKEAQATSILSRRWQYVWAYCTTLNFDAEKNLIRLHELDREALELEMCRCVNWVDSVLKQHRALDLERFRVSFKLGPRSCIDEWIQFAMRKGVQMLELDFSAYTGLFDEKYIFSNKLLGISVTSALKSLCSEYIDFKCLEVLDLKSVNVDQEQEALEYFMSNCSLLERLTVYASSSLVNLRVVGQLIALKYLAIQQCYNIESIEICDANLVSFIYEGDLKNLLLRNLPLLVEVYFSERLRHDVLEIAFRSLSFCLSQLEILKLNFTIVWPERDFVIPLLPNSSVWTLELAFDEDEDCVFLHLASFIEESPCLHTLVLLLGGNFDRNSLVFKKRAAKYSHVCLKVVGYCGYNCQIELVKYLTKTASNLEKIIFDPVFWWYRRPNRRRESRDKYVVEMEEFSRVLAQRLKEKLPATLEVVCL